MPCNTIGEGYEDIIENKITEMLSKIKDNEQKGVKGKPKQYDIGIDTFTRMRANATFEEAMGFIRWNIDKYNTRKKGCNLDDYIKIKDYCDEAIWWIKKDTECK